MRKMNYGFVRKLWFGVAAAGALCAIGTGSAAAQTVTTPGGTFPAETFQGVAGTSINTFLGIRFAAPPTGALRFALPTPPAKQSGTVSATSFGSACPQPASPFGTAATDEDCLFLNVYVPTGSKSKNLPVMLFYYGGAFVDGAGSIYDPTNLAIQGNTIVVTMNYRLGILGYMADAALSAQAANGVSGNYGLGDQQFALKWVHQNIAAFGGNPNKVTIFGESAGAFSVCANIVSPVVKGLFSGAISESGPCAEPLPTLASAETQGATIVAALGCNDSSNAATVACLRGLSVSSILAEQGNITNAASLASLAAFFPNVDGVLIPQQPATALILGEYNHVPVIEGTNHDEGRLFVALGFDLNPAIGTITTADYQPAIEAIVQELIVEEAAELGTSSSNSSSSSSNEVTTLTNEILNEYPLSNFAGPGEALGAVLTDSIFSCTANITDEVFSLEVPTFGYELNDENAPMIFLPPVSFPYGAAHTDELQFIFSFPGIPSQLSSSEQTLATTMKSYWTTFAANGNPNSGNTPNWTKFSLVADNDQSLIAPTPKQENNLANAHHCNFWIGILTQTILSSIAITLAADGIVE